MTTTENNITRLVEARIISIDLPKMGGILVIRCGSAQVEFDTRDYYGGRGSKYNKNINHEQVVIKITAKELATATRHYKMSLKVKSLRQNAMTKAGASWFTGEHQYTFTKARKLYFPELKELLRIKI